jgi:hypothetical protein
MPTHLLLRAAWQMLDNDPKNQLVINPCFRRQLDIGDPLSGTDAQQLCDDLAAGLTTWAGTADLTVRAYNLQGSKPNYPLAEKHLNVGTYVTPTVPPELAVCLSFYGGQNQPSKRGRLFLPAFLCGVTGSPGLKISAGTITKAESLVSMFSGLGGANVDWIVWSRTHQTAAKVDHYWVDNAWDIQRSRGIKADVRVVKTTSG